MPSDEVTPTTRLRFLSFESRRAEEMRSLISRMGGDPTVAPSMRELPLTENPEAHHFAEELLAGRIDAVVFLTGAGAEVLLEAVRSRLDPTKFLRALDRRIVIVRGPKPTAVLRKWGVHIDLKAPEPNTWRELAAAIRDAFELVGKTVGVQEYGKPNEAFYEELRALGATVLPVPVYRWALPLETGPLERAIRDAASDMKFDVFAFTSAQQVEHVLAFAEQLRVSEEFREALQKGVIVSIGPTCSETLQEHGLKPDLEASPPKMGILVRLAVEKAPALLAGKRGAA